MIAAAPGDPESCLICLRPVPSGEYHVTCLRRLYGSDTPPRIDLTEATLRTVALATLGRTVMPGVQPKISLGLARDRRRTLRVEAGGGPQRFILKPQNAELVALPENEHLSMQIARLFGVLVPDNGLIRLADGGLAYIVARFDRLPDGRKLRQEDFAQLGGLMPSEKYDATGADCARIVERYSSRAGADLVRLFERFVLAYWVGDGDMHMKNLSLLAEANGRHGLSPAYDIVCSSVYGQEGYSSAPALDLGPGDERATRDTWFRFADACRLPGPAARAILRRPAQRLAAAEGLVTRSHLRSRPMRVKYTETLRARADALDTVAR